MNLVRLIYASRFSDDIDAKAIQDILETSRKNNPRQGITGALCYAPGLFMQCLEGPRRSISALYRHIANDPRNSDVTLLSYGEIDERACEHWSMAYIRADDITEAMIMRFSESSTFDPYAMNANQALGFILTLAEEKHYDLRDAMQSSAA